MNTFEIILSAVLTVETGILITSAWRIVKRVDNVVEALNEFRTNYAVTQKACEFNHNDISKEFTSVNKRVEIHDSILSEHARLLILHEKQIDNLENGQI